MKKLIILAIFALASCSTPDSGTKECDCKTKTYINNQWNGQIYDYSKDCKDDGKVLSTYTETFNCVQYVAKDVVECN